MSIYATLWTLKFPRYGDDYHGCEWIEVRAQGVPPHIGSSSVEDEDIYAAFLPPPVDLDERGEHPYMRAVVFVVKATAKGTSRSHQEYVDPLFTICGKEYAESSFESLHERICDALRDGRPRVVAQLFRPGNSLKVLYNDGSSREVKPDDT